MNKQFIANARNAASEAIKELDTAKKLIYCAQFKETINTAACLLEQATKELRMAERGVK